MTKKLIITVDLKTSQGWREYKFVFKDEEKTKEVTKLIEKELGHFTKYIVIDTTMSGIVTGDEEYQAAPYLFDELYRLADEIVFPPLYDP